MVNMRIKLSSVICYQIPMRMMSLNKLFLFHQKTLSAIFTNQIRLAGFCLQNTPRIAMDLKPLKLISMGLGGSREVSMDGPEAEFIKCQIANNQVVIFSKTYCPFCTMAKEAFDKLKKEYLAIELDSRNDANAIMDILGQMTGARSVPRVFVNGNFIGGGTDVKQMYESGQLATLF